MTKVVDVDLPKSSRQDLEEVVLMDVALMVPCALMLAVAWVADCYPSDRMSELNH